MTTYSQQEVDAFAAHAGFSSTAIVPGTGGMTQQEVIVGIAYAESSFISPRVGDIGNPHGSSYGILQINTFWIGRGISIAGAQNPQEAFNFAYNTISHHGTYFGDWTTFTNGAYKTLKQQGASSSRGLIKLPAHGWWDYPAPDDLGQPDRYGGIPKPDANIYNLPANYPIATILSGTVTHVSGGADPWDGTVTIRLDSRINSLATHIAFLHLSQINTSVGKHVSPGDVIGHAGSRPLGSQNAALGFALYPGDIYGHGTEWANMTVKNLKTGGPLNPIPLIEAAKNGTLTEGAPGVGGGSSGGSSGGSNGGSGGGLLDLFTIDLNTPFLDQTKAKLADIQIAPDDTAVTILVLLDNMLNFYNPLNAFAGGNIISDFGDFLYAIGLDFGALSTRIVIWAIGIYILFKVFNSVINVTGPIAGAFDVGSRAAMVAGSFA